MSEKHKLGKYRLLAELGHGGMADVFLAMIEGPAGLGFAKLAVIKRLRANLVEDPEFITMLIDEARITARLNHPNVVQMLEVGQIGDEYFLAMEYLDGQPLHRVERRAARAGAQLSRTVQITILIDVLAGLQHAHDLLDYDGSPLEIIHRDVTPHNVFVTYDGQVKVMDFGIAKAAGRVQETQHGIVKGKTRFMSPEQATGASLDRRADIFAVGILLWQAATGKRFWGELDDLMIVEALVTGRYERSPKAVSPDVPDAVDRICRRALAPRAADRYANALEMQQELEAFLGPSALTARRELVNFLSEQFVKERAQLRSIVEKASKDSLRNTMNVALLATRSATNSAASFPGISQSIPPQTSASDVEIRTVSSTPPSPATVLQEPPVATSPPPRATRASFAAAVIAIALAIASVALAAAFREEHAARHAQASVVMSDFVDLSAVTRARAKHHAGGARAGAAPTPAAPPSPAVAVAPPPPRSSALDAPSVPTARPAAPPAATSPPAAAPSTTAPANSRSRRLHVDTNDPWEAK